MKCAVYSEDHYCVDSCSEVLKMSVVFCCETAAEHNHYRKQAVDLWVYLNDQFKKACGIIWSVKTFCSVALLQKIAPEHVWQQIGTS